jgi:hypothetical protein
VRLQFGGAQGGRERTAIDIASVASGPAPAESTGETEAPDPDDNSSAAATESADFGLFGRDKNRDEPEADDAGPRKPGRLEAMVAKLADTLGAAIEDAATLEVRTYVSSNTNAAAAADRETLAREGDLRAFTRIRIDGDMDVILPQVDGKIDTQLWELHLEFVKQAQQARAQTLETVLSALSKLTQL